MLLNFSRGDCSGHIVCGQMSTAQLPIISVTVFHFLFLRFRQSLRRQYEANAEPEPGGEKNTLKFFLPMNGLRNLGAEEIPQQDREVPNQSLCMRYAGE